MEKNMRDFSLRIAEIVRYLNEDGKKFPLSDKLLDCGVGAGLAVREGNPEAAAVYVRRADYIIEMATAAGYLAMRQDTHIRSDCQKLLNTLSENAGGQTK